MLASFITKATEAAASAGVWARRQAMTGPTWLRVTGLGVFLFGFPVLLLSKLVSLALFGVGLWLLFKPWSPPGEVEGFPRAKTTALPPWEKRQ
jgi:hypothetical protein